jgi:hypothetical protein
LRLPMRKARRRRSLVQSHQRIAPSKAATIGSPETTIVNHHRHDPKTRKAAALAKSTPKTVEFKRTAIPDRSKAASDTEQCRLSTFGGLRKALNLSGCEI